MHHDLTKKLQFMFDEKGHGIVASAETAKRLSDAVKVSGSDITVLPTNNKYLTDAKNPDHASDFAREWDSLTILDEYTDTILLRNLQRAGVRIYPSPDVIDVIRQKQLLIEFLEENCIPVVTGWEVMGNPDETNRSHQSVHEHGNETLERKARLAFRVGKRIKQSENVEAERIITVLISRTAGNSITCHAPMLLVSTENQIYAEHRMCSHVLSKEIAVSCCHLASRVALSMDLTGSISVEIVCDKYGNVYVNDVNLTVVSHVHTGRKNVHPLVREIEDVLDIHNDANVTHIPIHSGIIEPAAFRKHVMRTALQSIACPEEAMQTGRGKAGTNNRICMPTEAEMNELIGRSMMIQYLLNG